MIFLGNVLVSHFKFPDTELEYKKEDPMPSVSAWTSSLPSLLLHYRTCLRQVGNPHGDGDFDCAKNIIHPGIFKVKYKISAIFKQKKAT